MIEKDVMHSARSLLAQGEYEGAIESAIETALALLGECREDIATLGQSVHSDALAQITWFLAGLLEKCRK
jgi:octaprenyl-diphosphate synthase